MILFIECEINNNLLDQILKAEMYFFLPKLFTESLN